MFEFCTFVKMNSKLIGVFVALLAICGDQAFGYPKKGIESLVFKTDEDLPIFVQSLKQLQREPPLPPVKSRATVQTEWITQKLDHFDENETRTWEMRYMTNDEFLEDGSPIFIYLGGEWTITAGSITGGHTYDMAKENKAILYYTEHRFYGESKPTSDLVVENLQYLHVKQALADLAHFIETKRAEVPELANSKVFIVGGSYSATMAVWFKRLYPDMVVGGWASSAPIFAKINFVEYKEVTGRAILELGSQKCYNRIQNGIAELESMFQGKRAAEAKAMMKLCNNFDENNDLDVWSLFGSISNIFASYVQYQEDDDVEIVCDYLMQFDDDATAIANFLLLHVGNGCLDSTYKSTVSYYLDTSYDKGASRPWTFQTCNEYGWFQTSGSRNQPFGTKFPVALYTTLCYDVFGKDFTNENINLNAATTNEEFGGLSPEVENIYMTHGELDPWSAMGHTVDDGAVVISKASHCKDLKSISPNDSEEMLAAKEGISKLVRLWLAV